MEVLIFILYSELTVISDKYMTLCGQQYDYSECLEKLEN